MPRKFLLASFWLVWPAFPSDSLALWIRAAWSNCEGLQKEGSNSARFQCVFQVPHSAYRRPAPEQRLALGSGLVRICLVHFFLYTLNLGLPASLTLSAFIHGGFQSWWLAGLPRGPFLKIVNGLVLFRSRECFALFTKVQFKKNYILK